MTLLEEEGEEIVQRGRGSTDEKNRQKCDMKNESSVSLEQSARRRSASLISNGIYYFMVFGSSAMRKREKSPE
ncbi:hypothetical protein EYF80_028286 [Liparis tanakae]|uniref:Uncharacterized protein n=1 Tax=Liparis tanakae TaxID=230148 RepID=A0A4Z2H7D8_9TELE|nr:hypothetical protein EYF80_028286 [Liparis tanakae]